MSFSLIASNVERERFQSQLEMLVQELEKSQLDLLEKSNQLKATQQQLASAQQNNVGKSGIDDAQRKEIEAQLIQMEEFKKQLDNQAKAIESERKLFEEQRYVLFAFIFFYFSENRYSSHFVGFHPKIEKRSSRSERNWKKRRRNWSSSIVSYRNARSKWINWRNPFKRYDKNLHFILNCWDSTHSNWIFFIFSRIH